MKRAIACAAIGLCAVLGGCRGERPDGVISEPTGMAAKPPSPVPSYPGAPAVPSGSTPSTTPPPASPVTNAPVIMDRDIPVEADYEEEAEREIRPGNLDAEMTRIEQELAQAPAAATGPLPSPAAGQPAGAATAGTGGARSPGEMHAPPGPTGPHPSMTAPRPGTTAPSPGMSTPRPGLTVPRPTAPRH